MLSIRKHGIIIPYETCLNPLYRFDQARLTHEEHGSFESLISSRFYLTKYLSVGNTLFNSDLRGESENACKSGRVKYRVRLLDGGTVCRGIGEWNTEFDYISSPALHSQQDVDSVISRGVASSNEGNQCCNSLGFRMSMRGFKIAGTSDLLLLCLENLSEGLHDGSGGGCVIGFGWTIEESRRTAMRKTGDIKGD